MSHEELTARYLYFGTAILHMSKSETMLTAVGELQDMIEVHNQINGFSKPKEEHTIDDIM